MCSVSAVSDDFLKRQPQDWHTSWPPIQLDQLNQLEINRLRIEVASLKAQLEAARNQDIQDGSPDCHMEDKVNIIKGLAKALGVDLGDVFKGHK